MFTLCKKVTLFPILSRNHYLKLREINNGPNGLREFVIELQQKLNLKTLQDWNSINKNIIISNGGNEILKKYSIYEIKCAGYPKEKEKIQKPPGYWQKQENINKFITKLKNKYKLETIEEWDSLTQKNIIEEGGNRLLNKYSLYDIKVLGNPNGKLIYKNVSYKTLKYWEKKENIDEFLNKLKNKLKLKDWNKITKKQIKLEGGEGLLKKYSLYEIKCILNNKETTIKPKEYWKKKENINNFLIQLNEKFNLKKITKKQIEDHGGKNLLKIISLKNIKNFHFLGENLIEDNFLNDLDCFENVQKFIQLFSKKLNLNNFNDWNLITKSQIQFFGGNEILNKYSLYEFKCLGFPDGKLKFKNDKLNKPIKYWENYENINSFLTQFGEKFNLKSPDDWNLITQKQIQNFGGSSLLKQFSMYDIKCLACPHGKEYFTKPLKTNKYWDKFENIEKFLKELEIKFNLKTANDWNSITSRQIYSIGGGKLLKQFSLYDIKCFGFPDGKDFFKKPLKPKGYWDNLDNVQFFINDLKSKFNLQTPSDWKRISKAQIQSQGGWSFIYKYLSNPEIKKSLITKFPEISYLSFDDIYFRGNRSSQRWLFLQVQKLFPNDEIIEDYFHSDISRITGYPVQFDIFLMSRNIAIEYHGKQHYEDISSGFSSLEIYNSRDEEKIKLCKQFGIQLFIIPYWWDNQIDSLREKLISENINFN